MAAFALDTLQVGLLEETLLKLQPLTVRDDAKLVHHRHTCDRHDEAEIGDLSVPLKTQHQLNGMTHMRCPATGEKKMCNLRSAGEKITSITSRVFFPLTFPSKKLLVRLASTPKL